METIIIVVGFLAYLHLLIRGWILKYRIKELRDEVDDMRGRYYTEGEEYEEEEDDGYEEGKSQEHQDMGRY